MKVFDKFNQAGGSKCPVCKTNDDKPTVLIAIDGTEKDDNIEAQQVHLACINLRIRSAKPRYDRVIYQVLE